MDNNEFLDKIDAIIEVYKKRNGSIRRDQNTEYYEGYNGLVDKYHQARVHSNGEFPEKIFASIAPLQDADELAYIRANYQPETRDVFTEFSNTVKKAITNGVIEFPKSENDSSNDLAAYLDNDIENFDNIKGWADGMVDHKIIDANGVVIVWPTPLIEDDVIVSTKPQPIIYPIESVVWRGENDEFIVLTSKHSIVESRSKPVNEGLVFRYVGVDRFMEAQQFGKKIDYRFDVTFDFEHEIKNDRGTAFSPAKNLMGKVIIREDSVYFESAFDIAVGFLNLSALHASNDLIILRKVGYPTRVTTRTPCKNVLHGSSCEGGYIRYSDGEGMVEEICKSCKGLGYENVVGPFSELVVPERGNLDSDAKSNTTALNAMTYVSPSIEIPKHLEELQQVKINRAKEVLHLKAETRGSGDISATEKNIDKQHTEAYIRPISDQIWSIIEFVVECIGRLKYPTQYDELKPAFIRPANFDLMSAEDYVIEISNAKTAGLPNVIIQDLVFRYMSKVHKDSTLSRQIYQIIDSADRLVAVTSEQVVLGLSRGTIQKWEAILHDSIFYFIDRLIRQNDKFLELDTDQQIELIQNEAKAAVVSEAVDLPTALEP